MVKNSASLSDSPGALSNTKSENGYKEQLAKERQVNASLRHSLAAQRIKYKQLVDHVKGVPIRFTAEMLKLIEQSPELGFIMQQLEKKQKDEASPVENLHEMFSAIIEVFAHMKHLLNPMNLPLKMTPDGLLETLRLGPGAVGITDVREFTNFTRSVNKKGKDIFDVLSHCYFQHVCHVLEAHQCRYLNFTGDGLVVLSLERKDSQGKVLLPALDNLVIATLDLVPVTNSIAKAWKTMGLKKSDGGTHDTGFGLCSAEIVSVGDPLIPDQDFSQEIFFKKFNEAFTKFSSEFAPQYKPKKMQISQVRSVQAISPAINRASRLEGLDKVYPKHTAIMVAEDVAKLCKPLRDLFEPLDSVQLRGVMKKGEKIKIMGILRHEKRNVPDLLKAAMESYKQNLPKELAA